MKKIKKTDHGFTLTELIIVIVIIGILAAVLIPTITQYVERAKLSNDKSDARNMSMLLSVEAYDLDMDYFDPTYVINFLGMNGYTLKSTAKGYNFYYDFVNNKIQVVDDQTAGLNAEINHNILKDPLNKLRYFGGNIIFIDQNNSETANAINTVTYLLEDALLTVTGNKTVGEIMQENFDSMSERFKTKYALYDPTNTVYINEQGYFSNGNSFSNIIITKGTTRVPEIPKNEQGQIIFDTSSFNNVNQVYIPTSVFEIPFNSFLDQLGSSEVFVNDPDIINNVNNNNLEIKLQNNKYTKYDTIINIEFIYKLHNEPETQGAPKDVVMLDENSQIAVVFTKNGKSIIVDGSSLDIKCYGVNGIRYYDVRLFDKNGVLYARGILKY